MTVPDGFAAGSAGAAGFAPGSTLAEVAALLSPHGLELLRAWPRDEQHLLLEAGRGGATVAGQWFASPDRAAEVARRTPHASLQGRVVLHARGADRRLPGLATLLARPGAELVAHRPERRGVVRLPREDGAGPAYAKVVRASALPDVARTARAAADLPVRTPALVQVDQEVSAVLTAALPGRTLHDLLGTPAGPDACRAAGAALAQLHRAPVLPGLRHHGVTDERAVVQRWQRLAEAHGLAPAFPEQVGAPAEAGEAGEAEDAGEGDEADRPGLLHRDFHDKQVVVDQEGQVGLLDFDLLAAGSPVVDLANFLVHLDLRVRQGLVTDAAPLRAAVLEGYEPTPRQLARLHTHEATTWRRLSAVYAFRPASSVT